MRPEIEKRIYRSDPFPKKNKPYRRFEGDKCVICGRGFKSDDCPHNWGDNEAAFRVYNENILLN